MKNIYGYSRLGRTRGKIMGAWEIFEGICKVIANRGNEILDETAKKLMQLDDRQLQKLYKEKKKTGNSPLFLEKIENELRRRGKMR